MSITGRSRTLRVNYRTSHQIRTQADRLLAPELSDVDGNIEQRRGTVSVFEGPEPRIEVFASPDAGTNAVAEWLRERGLDGVAPDEMAIFVRSTAQLPRATSAAGSAGLTAHMLDEHMETRPGCASICTMHLAKGMEFRAVAVMACDDEVVPLAERIAGVTDEGDLEEVYNTERHLLYVACTRARDHLMVSAVDPPSEFLDDLARLTP